MESKNAFPWRCLIVGMIIAIGGSFHNGYQATVLNPTERIFKEFVNETTFHRYAVQLSESAYRILWSVILNITLVGNILGTLALRVLSERWGRRRPFYLSSIFILIGLVFQSVSKLFNSYELIMLGRFVTGIGAGLSMALEGVFLNEISPTKYRGLFTSMTGAAVQLGFVFGCAMALSSLFGTPDLWPYAFVAEMVPTVILLLALPFVQESPRFLLMRGDMDQCKNALSFFGHYDVDGSIRDIQSEMDSQKDRARLKDVWTKIHLRRATWLGCLLVTAASMSGITYINYFSTQILTTVGLESNIAQYATLGIFFVFFLSTLIGGLILDKLGRRWLLLITIMALILINIALMTCGAVYESQKIRWVGYSSLGAIVAFAIAYGLGMSNLQFVSTPEMVPFNARLIVQLIVMIVQKVSTLIAGVVFYPMQGSVGSYCFLFYITPLIVCFFIFLKQFPETKKKSIVQVMQILGYNPDEKARNEYIPLE